MKRILVLLLVICIFLLNSCSSTPKIEGLWQADFWDNAYVKFAPQLRFYAYANQAAIDNEDSSLKGEYRLSQLDEIECFFMGISNETMTDFIESLAAEVEFTDDKTITLKYNEACLIDDDWLFIGHEENSDEIHLIRMQ